MNIHPLAIVSPEARLGRDVQIGPFAVIEGDVEIGDGCILASHVVIKDGVRLGPGNIIHEGTVLGGFPQHVNRPKTPGLLTIGSGNTIREHVTMHRAMKADAVTLVGDKNYVMASSHIAHDCTVGNNVIFANGALLAGHVIIEDRAFISGAVGIHQFCRVGRFAMVGAHAKVVQDVPPYVTIDGVSGCVVGLNQVGLRRNGFTAEDIAQLKMAYRLIYRRGLKWSEVLAQLKIEFAEGPAAVYSEFLTGGTRGFVQERRVPTSATLKFRSAAEDQSQPTIGEFKARVAG